MRAVIGCGGTGGHINPALAIAKYIMSRDPSSEIIFCGANGGMEEKLIPREGFKLKTFEIHGFRRQMNLKGIEYNLKNLSDAFKSVHGAEEFIDEFKPDIAIGCGGYASFPAVYAAQKRKIPSVVLEVNALAGFATKALMKKATAVMISFEATRGQIKNSNIVLTGSPVREDILFAKHDEARSELGFDKRPLIVSVWGSLGAERMNHIMTDFIAMNARDDKYNLIHAIGSYGYKWVPEEIAKKGVDLSKHPNIDVRDYIYDAARVYAAADLIMCRGGAGTLCEMAVMGKPIIVVPSPNVAENHQEKNARAIEEGGGAVVIVERECTAEKLYATAGELLSDPDRLKAMSRSITAFAKPDAMQNIYKTIQDSLKSRN